MPFDSRPLAIFLMGPTASGKTALACELSERFPLELVSVDSALVYRGMDIGTAKPDAATLARYPHDLIDIRDPAQPYSAADFREDAIAAMHRIGARGKVPLLVGGTGLYFRALQQGLSDLPEADPELRGRLSEEAQRIGWLAMHARLARLDPQAAARIGSNDAQRLQRALEVIELTGRPLSELQQAASISFPWRVLKLALLPEHRSTLHERIAQRFDAMLAAGFLDEVRTLRARGDLHPDLPSMRAVGYRQALEHLGGATDTAEFRDRGIFATRQLAKRQITWLRSDVGAKLIDPDRPDVLKRASLALDLFIDRAH
ncbi:tRNA (adenosine(37)-N6)-dimethylallyltransferase MiaA [Rhodanobacter sp. L36]|uniref:tRNA (adenosine(37)-N6)-dimethylallyltransferase MiaA n=1 Tax=Rhodanobacter sp. L36 TaxID=1747221 RepID=UPI00131BF36F|nr:tRNA (adenosine(37)-N6)-dimethylallyltransferase MiaA [Rhodanobacter sp. L36]